MVRLSLRGDVKAKMVDPRSKQYVYIMRKRDCRM